MISTGSASHLFLFKFLMALPMDLRVCRAHLIICNRRDSNSQGLIRASLNRMRLPISPRLRNGAQGLKPQSTVLETVMLSNYTIPHNRLRRAGSMYILRPQDIWDGILGGDAARERDRTSDTLIKNQVLSQLSYTSVF